MVFCVSRTEKRGGSLGHFAVKLFLGAGLLRVNLFIDLGCQRDFGTRWRGAFGTFMVTRPI